MHEGPLGGEPTGMVFPPSGQRKNFIHPPWGGRLRRTGESRCRLPSARGHAQGDVFVVRLALTADGVLVPLARNDLEVPVQAPADVLMQFVPGVSGDGSAGSPAGT